ncbi:hypothetical protein SGRIM128S_02059 [Streptomyces griseomycini]
MTCEGSYEHQELRLHRDGLIYPVSVDGIHHDLSAGPGTFCRHSGRRPTPNSPTC